MRWLVIGVYLAGCSVFDLKRCRIPVWLLLGGLLLAAAALGAEGIRGNLGLREAGITLFPGAFLLLYSRLTEGKVGAADGIMVMTAGMLQPGAFGIWLSTAACLLLCLFAAAGMLIRRTAGTGRFPYAPFLTVAAALMWITGMF